MNILYLNNVYYVLFIFGAVSLCGTYFIFLCLGSIKRKLSLSATRQKDKIEISDDEKAEVIHITRNGKLEEGCTNVTPQVHGGADAGLNNSSANDLERTYAEIELDDQNEVAYSTIQEVNDDVGYSDIEKVSELLKDARSLQQLNEGHYSTIEITETTIKVTTINDNFTNNTYAVLENPAEMNNMEQVTRVDTSNENNFDDNPNTSTIPNNSNLNNHTEAKNHADLCRLYSKVKKKKSTIQNENIGSTKVTTSPRVHSSLYGNISSKLNFNPSVDVKMFRHSATEPLIYSRPECLYSKVNKVRKTIMVIDGSDMSNGVENGNKEETKSKSTRSEENIYSTIDDNSMTTDNLKSHVEKTSANIAIF